MIDDNFMKFVLRIMMQGNVNYNINYSLKSKKSPIRHAPYLNVKNGSSFE